MPDKTIIHRGLHGAPTDLIVYASEQCHYSIEKSADILGLGRDNLRKIRTDERFHIQPDSLREEIKQQTVDAGRAPFCVVGVAGTTSTGVIDPLEELAAIAHENGCWFHVDAAYGGVLAFSELHKNKLHGIEHADSITFDPHKWMFVPFACGAVLVREGGRVLRDAFDIKPGVSQRGSRRRRCRVRLFPLRANGHAPLQLIETLDGLEVYGKAWLCRGHRTADRTYKTISRGHRRDG